MSEYSNNAERAALKGERRESKIKNRRNAMVVNRYGVWTGEGYLREGQALINHLAEKSVKAVPAKIKKGKGK